MKHLFALVFVLCGLVVFAPSVQAQADWEILSFHADIDVQQDGTVVVQETIDVNFNYDRHGIFRDIPVKYRNRFNQHISLGFDLINVTDENGQPYEYEVSKEGAYKRIKIGDPSIYVSGAKTYVITYEASRGLRYFADHDELYWNVTGNNWDVPIALSSAEIHLPFSTVDGVDTICYTGSTGSTEQNCETSVNPGAVTFTAQDFLTVAVSWPKGLVDAPMAGARIFWFLGDNFGFLFPFLAALAGFYVWSKRGRDPKGRGVVRQYEAPDQLSPTEVDYLVNQRLNPSAISAEIVWLANQGYLKIKEQTKKILIITSQDYELQRTNKTDADLKPHQRALLDALFADSVDNRITISDLPDTFYKTVDTLREATWQSMASRHYFAGKPENAIGTWIALAVVTGIFLFLLIALFDGRIDIVIGVITSIIVLIVFALLMPKRTVAGVAAYEYALGFKQYIEGAETERVKWEEKQNLFFEVLPYAMVFGIADKWAKVFEGKLQTPPQWYSGTNPGGFSPVGFNRSLAGFSSATTAHSSPPSSNSSGFSGGSSGGGGGGGGGGSW